MSCSKTGWGSPSLTFECSTRHWFDPLARAKYSLLLKTHDPSERESSTNGYNNGGGGYEELAAKTLIRGFLSTLPLNASRQQSTWLGSPTRTLNVSKRHPQGQVGTGVLCVELSVVYQLSQHSYLYNCSQ